LVGQAKEKIFKKSVWKNDCLGNEFVVLLTEQLTSLSTAQCEFCVDKLLIIHFFTVEFFNC